MMQVMVRRQPVHVAEGGVGIDWRSAYGQALEAEIRVAVARAFPLLPPYATAEVIEWCLRREAQDQDGTLPPARAARVALADYLASH